MGRKKRIWDCVLFYCSFLLLIFPVAPSLSAINTITDDATELNRPKVGDPVQERWMSSTNWTGDDQLKGLEPDYDGPRKKLSSTVRIFLDPGHGGKDSGAQGYFAISESKLAMRLAKRVQFELLRSSKYRGLPMEIMMSRQGDEFLPLKERYLAANAWDADVFVSIHGNSSPSPKAKGFEVYFLSNEASDERTKQVVKNENDSDTKKESLVTNILADTKTAFHIRESSAFAESVFNAMSRIIRPNVRAVRQGPFTVLAGTDMPAVLVEVGYVSHPDEARLLGKEAYLNRVASAISSGVIEYFVDTKRLKRKSQPNDLRVSKKR
jgi:N-acetylmuramoyl-L-alanine amidase